MTRAAAYEALARSYWRPVYVYVRLRWRKNPEDAQDLTQAFFARVLERAYLDAYDPSKARFRTFVRTCLDRFLANEAQAAARQKRGGALVTSVDFARFDADLAQHARSQDADPERWFHREWIRALFADAIDRLGCECVASGHHVAFTLFQRYDVEDGEPGEKTTYAALARETGLAVTDVTNELAWARRAFRGIVLDRLREICATEDEFHAEARDLLGIDPA